MGRLEFLDEFARALIAFLALFAQHFSDDPLKLAGDVGCPFREWRWICRQDGIHHLFGRFPGERRSPSQHLIKNYAETPDICTLTSRCTEHLLRRHIARGAEYGAQVSLDL